MYLFIKYHFTLKLEYARGTGDCFESHRVALVIGQVNLIAWTQ